MICSLRSFARAAALGLLLVGPLSGCAAYLDTRVTTFHREPSVLAGKRFVIEPDASQRDSLEYRTWADAVSQALVAKGLVVAAADSAADATVRLRYSVSEGRTYAYGYPYYPSYGYLAYGPVWGPYRRPYGAVDFAWAPAYPYGYGGGVGYDIAYTRELRVEIAERATEGPRLYEGTVISEGRSSSIAPVMPAMIRALFVDFPGPNGASRIVRVNLEPQPPRR